LDRLNAVQGLRAIAAWLVVLAHAALWAGEAGPLGLSLRTYEMFGSMGVLMFFAISGFIMAFTSGDAFGKPDASASFLKRRLIRVVPLYWLMTLLAATIIVRKGEALSVSHVVQSLLFIPHSTGGGLMRPVLGVGWSLNYEMFFYLLFAASLTIRRGLLAVSLMIMGLLAIGQLLNPFWNHRDPQSAFGAWTELLLLPFLIGLGLAFLHTRYSSLRFSHPFAWLFAAACAILFVQSETVAVGTYPAWWRVTVIVACAGMGSFPILGSERLQLPRWLVLSGDASYSLYLVHPLLFGIIGRLGGNALRQVSPFAAMIYFVVFSTFAAFFVHLCVEKPLTRWINGKSAQRGAQEPVPVGAAV
jgi:peptidoglycan/LPS O-acetylase OafA/YrhL